jgi:hypothetical protein
MHLRCMRLDLVGSFYPHWSKGEAIPFQSLSLQVLPYPYREPPLENEAGLLWFRLLREH